MKYLSFDEEFATSKGNVFRICEFGYVLFDENYNVLEKDNLLINPDIDRKEWDWYVLKKIVHHKKDEYINSPKFNEFYDKISQLFNEADGVFGFCIKEDITALKQECQRYQKPLLEEKVYDISEIYKNLTKASDYKSIRKILTECNILGDNNDHEAVADAFNTMLILKELDSKKLMSLSEINNN